MTTPAALLEGAALVLGALVREVLWAAGVLVFAGDLLLALLRYS